MDPTTAQSSMVRREGFHAKRVMPQRAVERSPQPKTQQSNSAKIKTTKPPPAIPVEESSASSYPDYSVWKKLESTDRYVISS